MTVLAIEHMLAFDRLTDDAGWTRMHHACRACEVLLDDGRVEEAARVFWRMVCPTAKQLG